MREVDRSIVVVDDEADLREPTAEFLRLHGFQVEEAENGATLDAILARHTPGLVILDVSMPGEDGFSIARRLRASDSMIGIIMLTARRDIIDRVVALELGADDYVMKPFEQRELVARANAVFRRLQATPRQPFAAAVETSDNSSAVQEFWVDTPRGAVCVPIDAIEWIEAAGDYVLLHTADRNYMLRVTMSELEEGLDPAALMRVHRSAFLRPCCVARLNRVGRRTHALLGSGAVVRVGEQYLARLTAAIG
ncbi:response regulator [Sphingomonas psychrotolerans]|uniref:Response regulator n=1 Tax=Sphingomonas psychrotolerans TaxID=1327635 RepID=A0ABU3N4H6_9SPHN|nr:response regulator [Sphingomonas psychrotolerans]MDT8758769.1 response regulator [Sphingomonas psychrotolerans]